MNDIVAMPCQCSPVRNEDIDAIHIVKAEVYPQGKIYSHEISEMLHVSSAVSQRKLTKTWDWRFL